MLDNLGCSFRQNKRGVKPEPGLGTFFTPVALIRYLRIDSKI